MAAKVHRYDYSDRFAETSTPVDDVSCRYCRAVTIATTFDIQPLLVLWLANIVAPMPSRRRLLSMTSWCDLRWRVGLRTTRGNRRRPTGPQDCDERAEGYQALSGTLLEVAADCLSL